MGFQHDGPDRTSAVRAFALATVFAAGCGNTNVSSGVAPSPIDMSVVFTPVGDGSSFTAQLAGQTFTSAGASIVSLAPGSYVVNGSFRGSGFAVGFQSLGSHGGVQSGSLTSLAGPAPEGGPCRIAYTNSDTPAVTQTFQLRFQVTSEAGNACPGASP